MKGKITFLLVSFFVNLGFGQQDQEMDLVEAINITDFLKNEPADKNFDNKYKVMEFWATWCAPCLAAVPHLNSLQDEFKDQDGLVFLSITYESPEKTRNTLERIDFQTIVVSDQSKQTQKNLKVEQNGIMTLPKTVLVDNNNRVRWTGHPTELTAEMIKSFVKDEGVTAAKVVPSEENPNGKNSTTNKKLSSDLLRIFQNKDIINIFSIAYANEDDSKMSAFSLPMGKYFDFNTNLETILSRLSMIQEHQVVLPEDLSRKNFNLVYKTSGIDPKKLEAKIAGGTSQEEIAKELFFSEAEKVKQLLLNALSLNEHKSIKSTAVYQLKITDGKKLLVNDSNEQVTHSGSNDTHLVFSNIGLGAFSKELSKNYNIILDYEGTDDQKFDFLIELSDNIPALLKELESYGLTLGKGQKEIEYYEYKR